MKKDLSKLMLRTLITYGFLLLIAFIIKLLGVNCFDLTTDSGVFGSINNLLPNDMLYAIYTHVLLYFNTLILTSISCNDNSKRMKIYVLITYPLSLLVSLTPFVITSSLIYYIINFLYLYLLCLIYTRFKDIKKVTKRYIIFTILNIVYQLVSVVTRGAAVNNIENSFLTTFLLNFDYVILLFITYKLYFKLGGEKLWYHYQEAEVGLFSHQQISLKKSQTKSQTNSSNKEKFKRRLYFILCLIWNLFTLLVILLIAKLNNTLVECLFILNAFWINKRVFGKPFHLPNAAQCFIVSNLTYYALNRVTLSIHITFLVPIILGIGLSYVTSKFVKYSTLKLYRGMPKEELHDILSKVTNNKLDIKICELYYCERETEERVAQRVNYSKESIQKHKKKINDQLKELSK